jgi:LmbE family N-acetylglucosaminyl deacetylase
VVTEAILVVAAHPDDEVIGCGGTMARLADEGHQVHVLILAEGVTSRAGVRNAFADRPALNELALSAQRANKVLGAASVKVCGFPDNRMDRSDLLDVIKVIEEAVMRLRPQLVLTHHGGDLNVDHRVVHDAVLTACRPLPDHPVRELLFFEVASSTEWGSPRPPDTFAPNCFYDIERHLERKLAALREYASEMREFPHARSIAAIEHLARWRGATVGRGAAEAFEVGRSLV